MLGDTPQDHFFTCAIVTSSLQYPSINPASCVPAAPNATMKLEVYTVPTKAHSGGSLTPATSGGCFDAFAFYSNRHQRMNRLLMRAGDDDAMPRGASAPSNGSSPMQPSGRTTRVSFEIHPSLLLQDLLYSEDERPGTEGRRTGSIKGFAPNKTAPAHRVRIEFCGDMKMQNFEEAMRQREDSGSQELPDDQL